MQYTLLAAMQSRARQGHSRRRSRRRSRELSAYDLGTPPEGYEKSPDGGPTSYRKARADGGYDYWYDDGGGAAQGERQEEPLPDWTTNDGHYLQAPFEVDGEKFRFDAHQLTGGGPFELTFSRITGGKEVFKQQGMANRMAGLKVFSVVMRLAKRFVRERQPESFKFSADLGEPARVKLYEKMAERMAADGKYTLKATTANGKKVFLFQKAKAKRKSWWPWSRRSAG